MGSDYWRAVQLPNAEGVLLEHSPAEFETTQNAAAECINIVGRVEDDEWWRAGYDSLDLFYAAHEARHPDIRVYAAVGREAPVVQAFAEYEDAEDTEWPKGLGATIARLIAEHRAEPS
jgi:hypothetical protein